MFWDKSSFINVFLTVNVINIIKGFKIKSVLARKVNMDFFLNFMKLLHSNVKREGARLRVPTYLVLEIILFRFTICNVISCFSVSEV